MLIQLVCQLCKLSDISKTAFESPLVFCSINLTKIINNGIQFTCVTAREIRNSNCSQKSDCEN